MFMIEPIGKRIPGAKRLKVLIKQGRRCRIQWHGRASFFVLLMIGFRTSARPGEKLRKRSIMV